MKQKVGGVIWRLAIFMMVCVLGIAAMFMVFASLRFQELRNYNAIFTNVSGMQNGNFVRIAGVEVGKVKNMSINPDSTVSVEFAVDPSVVLTEGSHARIRWDNLIGGRYLALEEGAGGVKLLKPGETIPVAHTAPALSLDDLIGGFRPLFRALDPTQVNELTGQLIKVFEGQGATISSFLSQTAVLTNTLADRDELIGQVISNLNTVLGSLSAQSTQFDKAVTSLSELVKGLADRKYDISNSVAYVNAAAGTVADLLRQARPPFQQTVHQTDRTASIVVADHNYVDNILNTLPDKYRVLGRLGLYGDFFSFYLCDLVLKLNGKGGQPVFVKLAGQTTGRCATK